MRVLVDRTAIQDSCFFPEYHPSIKGLSIPNGTNDCFRPLTFYRQKPGRKEQKPVCYQATSCCRIYLVENGSKNRRDPSPSLFANVPETQ